MTVHMCGFYEVWRGNYFVEEPIVRPEGVVGHFVGVCWRRGMKVNGNESNVMVSCGKEGLECEIHVDGAR